MLSRCLRHLPCHLQSSIRASSPSSSSPAFDATKDPASSPGTKTGRSDLYQVTSDSQCCPLLHISLRLVRRKVDVAFAAAVDRAAPAVVVAHNDS